MHYTLLVIIHTLYILYIIIHHTHIHVTGYRGRVSWRYMSLHRVVVHMKDSRVYSYLIFIHMCEIRHCIHMCEICLYCKRALQKRLYSAKETYIWIDPTVSYTCVAHINDSRGAYRWIIRVKASCRKYLIRIHVASFIYMRHVNPY